jgi:outer membrane protein TolC
MILVAIVAAGCAATPIPPAETSYYQEQLVLARSAPSAAAPRAEAVALRDAAAKLDVRAAAESERIHRGDETEGLLDVESPAAREFLLSLADPKTAEDVLATTPLDVERALLAAYARNADVAAARANWTATTRMYEQATYLEDTLSRYSALTRTATPAVGAAPMRETAFPYPGVVALKGEMIDREVAMAREMTRMRLRDVVVATSKAWHVAVHHGDELKLRDEMLSLAKRAAEATRARVASGTSPQAELLEMESEVATAENDREHAVTSLALARAELNTLLARDTNAPLVLAAHLHEDPSAQATPVEPLLALARRFSPEIRIAQAEASRSAAAIRMSEAMLFAAPAPGEIASGSSMKSAMPVASSAASAAAPADAMGGAMPAARDAAPAAPSLPPRDAAPSGAPGTFGPDVAWIEEMRARHVGLERAAEESVKAAERRVLVAHDEMEAQRRMYVLAAKSTEPLSAQAVEERLKLYEAGRGDFGELVASMRRHLDAAHDAVAARHDYFMAQAMLWMAIGARPEVVRAAGEGEKR